MNLYIDKWQLIFIINILVFLFLTSFSMSSMGSGENWDDILDDALQNAKEEKESAEKLNAAIAYLTELDDMLDDAWVEHSFFKWGSHSGSPDNRTWFWWRIRIKAGVVDSLATQGYAHICIDYEFGKARVFQSYHLAGDPRSTGESLFEGTEFPEWRFGKREVWKKILKAYYKDA